MHTFLVADVGLEDLMSLLSGIEEEPLQATEFAKINDEEGSSLKRLCL